MGAIGLEPQAEYSQKMSIAHQLSGCGARILAILKSELGSFMPFYHAERIIYERLIYEEAQPDPFNN
jgi:hypothetical protein